MSLAVTERSKLKAALDLGPGVLDYVVGLEPHDFARLRNPLMRRLMPPRITLARIARMVGLPVAELIEGIHSAAGLPLDGDSKRELEALGALTESLPANPAARPDWARGPSVVVDLLESDDRLDADPMPPIQRAAKKLGEGETLLIRHRWEPAPLYDVWKHMGLEHFAMPAGPDEWHVYVRVAPVDGKD